MILDSDGIELLPGNGGRECPGNGKSWGEKGKRIECRCDECDYLYCCTVMQKREECRNCDDKNCPYAGT